MVAVDDPEGAIEKSFPAPVSGMFWGLPLALSVMIRVPLRVPPAVGSKKTLIVQFIAGETGLVQSLVVAKSAMLVVTLVVSGTFPLLVTVTV